MNPQRLEERRRFNEQMRARLKLVAAERGLPDADMKWLGRLRHDDVFAFIERHQLSYDWVLRGDPSGLQRQAKPSFRVIQGGIQ